MPPNNDIRFSEGAEYDQPRAEAGPTGITALVIGWGLAKDAQSARYVLLSLAVGAVVLSVIFLRVFGSSAPVRATDFSTVDALPAQSPHYP